jgi:hypothetical protein
MGMHTIIAHTQLVPLDLLAMGVQPPAAWGTLLYSYRRTCWLE